MFVTHSTLGYPRAVLSLVINKKAGQMANDIHLKYLIHIIHYYAAGLYRPHYASCPSVRLSVSPVRAPNYLKTKRRKVRTLSRAWLTAVPKKVNSQSHRS